MTKPKTKSCRDCGTVKPAKAFYIDRKRPNALHTYCRECCKIRALRNYAKADKTERARVHREWVRKNREYAANYKVAWALGITVEAVQEITSRGACQICGRRDKLRVDHNHAGGHVRGLLCDWCNKGLGFFFDSRESLQKAMAYLAIYDKLTKEEKGE